MILVEFAGLPNSGKSSSIQVVRNWMLNRQLKVQIIDEAYRRNILNPDCPNFRVGLQCWNANQSLNTVLETKMGYPNFDFILLDRGLFDVIGFIKLIHTEDFINDSDFDDIINYFTNPTWTKLVDIVFLFDITPEQSAARDLSTQMKIPPGKIRNLETLRHLSFSYEYVIKNFGHLFPKIFRIDTNGLSREETAQMSIQKLTTLFPNLS
jgi:thymidylate kinase